VEARIEGATRKGETQRTRALRKKSFRGPEELNIPEGLLSALVRVRSLGKKSGSTSPREAV